MNPIAWLALFAPVLIHAETRTVAGLPSGAMLALALLAAVLALAWRGDRDAPREPATGGERSIAWVAALAALALSVWMPTPVRESAWACALAFALLPVRAIGSLAACAVACGALAASLVHWLAPIALTRVEPEAAVGRLLGAALRAFGVHDASATERGLGLLVDGTQTLELGTGWTHLSLRASIALAAGGAVAAWIGKPLGLRARDALLFALALALATVVAAVAQVVLLVETRVEALLLDPTIRSIELALPTALFAALLLRVPRAGSGSASARPPLAALGASAAGSALIALAAFFPGIETRRGGSIAIDEGHSFWERLDVPLDRRNFGTLAVYNYSEWLRGLERRHGAVERLSGEIDAAALDGIDVLILKTPTTPYTIDEVDTIHEFVRAGGGLYLVGDHNDVFGMNTILNSVGREFGIVYRPDAVCEADYIGGQLSDPRAFPPHPLTRTMRPLHWMTSCSIEVSRGARPLLWTLSGFSDDPDYSVNNFIGDGKVVGAERGGPLAQVVCASPGAGRVLAFSDSTLFSNFSIFLPGVRELSFGGVEWLLWRERAPGWRPWACALGALALAFGAWASRRSRWPAAAAAIAGLAIAWPAIESRCATALGQFEHELDGEEVVFDATLCAGTLPIWHESHDTSPDDFWSLFLAYQRSGGLMRVAMAADETFRSKTTVLVWPKLPLRAGLIAAAERFVQGGGTLYVFDDRIAGGSAANELLAPFGLSLARPATGRRLLHGTDFERRATVLEHSTIALGGEPLLIDAHGDPLAARAVFGLGAVIAVGLAQELSVASLGTNSEVKGVRGFDLLQTAYALIDGEHRGSVAPIPIP